jgi:cytochrome c-type biogenesis protein CcmH
VSGRAVLAAVLACVALCPGMALGATPRASLTDIENDVMCPSCRESLAVAQSPQAFAERGFIRGLIAQGETKGQIERTLVSQYGPAVLARPPASGFNLTVYLLPAAIVILGLGTLVYVLPRWRRSTRMRRAQPLVAGAPRGPISARDATRLDEDLAGFDG